MSRIEKLTPEQIARFPEFVERWTRIGLCTDPADRPRAEAAINESYRLAGLSPPKKIVWCGSPLSQGLTRAIILDKNILNGVGDSVRASVGASVGDSVRASVWASVGDSVRDSVRDSVWASVRYSVRDSVGDSVWASVGASVRASVWASVGDSVGASVGDSGWASVWASVGASVGDSVWASVGDSVRDSVGASVWASVRYSVRDSGYGSHDAGWLSFYDYFKQGAGLTAQTEKLSGLLALAQSAGWFLPHENICWVSERHNILVRDERGQLHSLLGPACAYPDGWAIYAVHGVRVPEYVVMRPHEINMEKIGAETNAEVRRVMIERYGEDRYIMDSGMQPVAHDEQFGTLYVQEQDAGKPIARIRVINRSPEPDGSFKPYWLPINPELYGGDAGRIPQAAVASTWRTEPAGKTLVYKDWREYAPEFES